MSNKIRIRITSKILCELTLFVQNVWPTNYVEEKTIIIIFEVQRNNCSIDYSHNTVLLLNNNR